MPFVTYWIKSGYFKRCKKQGLEMSVFEIRAILTVSKTDTSQKETRAPRNASGFKRSFCLWESYPESENLHVNVWYHVIERSLA